MVEYFTVAGRRTTEMPPETKIGPKGQLLQRIGSYIPGRGGTFTYREVAPPTAPGTSGTAMHTSPVTLNTYASGIVQKAQGALGIISPTHAAVGGLAVAGVAGATIAGVRAFSGRRKKKAKARKKAKKSGGKSRKAKSRPTKSKSKGGSRANAKRNRRGGAVKAKYRGRKVLIAKNGTPYIIRADGKAEFIKR